MDDLISRREAIDAIKGLEFCHYMEFGEYIGEDTREVRLIRAEKAQDALQKLPSAQPERKKGKWIDMGDFEQCSACKGTHLKEVNTVYGKAIWIKSAYCPNCGADMRGKQS